MVVIYKRSVGITVWFLMWQELGVNNDPVQRLTEMLAQFQQREKQSQKLEWENEIKKGKSERIADY